MSDRSAPFSFHSHVYPDLPLWPVVFLSNGDPAVSKRTRTISRWLWRVPFSCNQRYTKERTHTSLRYVEEYFLHNLDHPVDAHHHQFHTIDRSIVCHDSWQQHNAMPCVRDDPVQMDDTLLVIEWRRPIHSDVSLDSSFVQPILVPLLHHCWQRH